MNLNLHSVVARCSIIAAIIGSLLATSLLQAQRLTRLPSSEARIVASSPDLASIHDTVLRSPLQVTYVLHAALSRGYLELANGPEPQRFVLPDLRPGTHIVTIPAGTALADPLGPTVECSLSPPVVGNGVTIMIEALFRPHDEGAAVYGYRPGPVARDYGDLPGDDAGAFRDSDRAITAYRVPGPRNVILRARLDRPLIEVRGVGFRDGDTVLCRRGMRHPITATTQMELVRVISTASHQGNKRMPLLLGGTIPIPRGLAEPPNAFALVGDAPR